MVIKMKKFVSAVLAFFVIFSLTACSGGTSGSGAASSASEQGRADLGAASHDFGVVSH